MLPFYLGLDRASVPIQMANCHFLYSNFAKLNLPRGRTPYMQFHQEDQLLSFTISQYLVYIAPKVYLMGVICFPICNPGRKRGGLKPTQDTCDTIATSEVSLLFHDAFYFAAKLGVSCFSPMLCACAKTLLLQWSSERWLPKQKGVPFHALGNACPTVDAMFACFN